eukprot:CAMPEP_0194748066 /NCGR_PEP_ID=MMETSP0323_2-20130528/2271_1 /TAXON_ID=2866 ORGANISM="Crypthecodinium cohnii, Strain Seligo" /NCGR_SAMPLE_ID=MMETSP0323_2 /ASSEMBLY_ACC=CAM_ASM_000346 /LENGTH=62 /DNA_ID=CAMNT_0039662073 /DNA_START=312 /DNA_END=501 /DNA_ORIENTATION=+
MVGSQDETIVREIELEQGWEEDSIRGEDESRLESQAGEKWSGDEHKEPNGETREDQVMNGTQ